MKYFLWNAGKNAWLKTERKISFEQIIFHIMQGHVLDIVEHPNRNRYQEQRMFIVEINEYAYLVPFVEGEGEILLKTIIPSRKATKKYLGKKETKNG